MIRACARRCPLPGIAARQHFLRLSIVIGIAAALPGCVATGPIASHATYDHVAVAADHPLASQAGAEILRQGGNAVDAAVATSFCLSVVRPHSCGIGGGGFMVIHQPAGDGKPAAQFALDYRETSPAAVDQAYFTRLDDPTASRYGVHAAGVPGTVAGLLHALDTWGTLDRATVLAPAIHIAREGFPADANHLAAAEHLRDLLDQRPELRPLLGKLWETLYRRGAIQLGDTVRNPGHARALEQIAEHGMSAFYEGEIAERIGAVMAEHGGPLTRRDLETFTSRTLEPIRGEFAGYQIIGMPLPSSGGLAVTTILALVDRRYETFGSPAPDSPDYMHLVAEAMKHAFADRAEWLADPAFVDVPVERLTSERYLDQLASRIERFQTADDPFSYGSVTPAAATTVPGGGTSHFSVIDADGMAVACTETINLTAGSLVAVPEFGFFLNNEMDDFTTIPDQPNAFGLRQSDRNLPEPGKRPLSSMSPTIVVKDGRARVVAGGSGGPRIITATAQVILNAIRFAMPPRDAVGRPRFHHQWMPNVLRFEETWDNASIRAALEARGHEIGRIDDVGVVQLISVDEDGRIRAACDPRKGGEPAGW